MKFQLVAESAITALGEWGAQYLLTPNYRQLVAPISVIDLPEQIADWLRAEPGPSNLALDAYRDYVARFVAAAAKQAIAETNKRLGRNRVIPMPEWAAADQPADRIVEWDVVFLAEFGARLRTIIEQHLKPGVCSAALPISMATRVPNPAGGTTRNTGAIRQDVTIAPIVADGNLTHPMCALTYKSNIHMKTILASLDTDAIRSHLTGDIFEQVGVVSIVGLPMRSGRISVICMNLPLPLGGLVDDIAQRAAWPDWRREADTWRSHVLVVSNESLSSLPAKRAAAEDVIRVALALASSSGASAVEWSAAELFYSPQEFMSRCEKTLLSADVLFRTTWYQGEGKRGMAVGARTKGMSLFGLPEIDYPPSGEDGSVIFNRLLNFATYILMTGVVPKDGDTLGVDLNVQGRVRHVKTTSGALMLAVVPEGSPAG